MNLGVGQGVGQGPELGVVLGIGIRAIKKAQAGIKKFSLKESIEAKSALRMEWLKG